MRKNKEKMIALGMCLVLTASSLNLGGRVNGNTLQVQAAELEMPEGASQESENREVTKPSETSGNTEVTEPSSQPTVLEGLSEEQDSALPEGASQVPGTAVSEEPSEDSGGAAQEDAFPVLEDEASDGTSQLLENETEGKLSEEEFLESEGMAQDSFLEPARIEPEDGIEPFAATDGKIAIDETNFPDSYFREYLLGTLSGYESVGIDADGDGMLSEEERNNVVFISIYGRPIRDFTGISYFPNLEEFRVGESLAASVELSGNVKLKNVDMSNNQKLVSVDLSGNEGLTDVSLNYNEKMERVSLSGCSQLTYLSLYGGSVSTLNLNGCIQLESLDCTSNQLGALDLSPAVQLKSLCVSNNQLKDLNLGIASNLTNLQCGNNQLDVLNLHNNQKLVRLECEGNRLKNLDIAGMLNLEILNCSNNQLAELNVTKNLKLLSIDCNSNPLRRLDISKNIRLEGLNINTTCITAIDVSANEQLRMGYYECWDTDTILGVIEEMADGRWLFDLTSQEGFQPDKLTISNQGVGNYPSGWNEEPNLPELTERGVVWKRNPVESGNIYLTLQYDLSNNAYLDGKFLRCNYFLSNVTEGYNTTDVELTESNFPDGAFRNYLREQFDRNNDGKFQPGTISELNISFLTDVKNLSGLEYFTSLSRLSLIQNSALSNLDVSKNNTLKYLYIDGTPIYCLDLRNNPNLQELNIGNVPVTSLYLAEDCKVSSWFVSQPIVATAVEENGRYALDLLEFGGLDQKRIADLSDGEIDGNKIYWNSKSEVPISFSYKFVLRNDYQEGEEYAECDVLTVNFSLTNNAPEQPEGKMIALTEENFPSVHLLNYLKEYHDFDKDGQLYTGDVTSIYLSGSSYTSLAGIEKLNCLQTLNIWNAPLRSLDLSSNTVLTSLCVTGGSLTNIRIDGCPYLEYVDLGRNSLTSLDVSQNKILRNLDVRGNSLINLDVSQNKNLKDLNVSENAITSLDLSGNTKLQVLNCSNNPTMVSLDLSSQKRKMVELHVLGNSIQNLQIDNMPNLTVLEIDSNNGGIKELDLSGNTKLQHLTVNSISLNTDWTKMTALRWISICQVTPLAPPTYFPGTIESPIVDESASNIPLKKMDLSNAENLQYCSVSMDSLGELDVHGCTNLENLSVGGGKLKALNVSGCTALFYLDCSGNQLETLDVSSCAALKSIRCSGNQLQAFDIRSNKALQELYCGSNKLSTVDTSKNAALKWFECSGNPIVSLDLSNNKAMLSTLNCYSTSLTSLDVSENVALESVSLGNQVFKVSEGDLQPESSLSKAASSSAGQNVRGADTGRYILRLDKYGNFDPSKVKNLTSGTAVANGIMWENKDAVPDVVSYDYDISNQYKLAGQTMPVQIVFKDGGYAGSDEYFPILLTRKPLSSCTVTLSSKSSYTGRAQNPKVVVKDGNYTLRPGTDYILSCKNNINAGNASVVLRGTGGYTGSVKKNFTIKKASQKIRCTKSFLKTYGNKAFSLKAKRTLGKGRLSYYSSNNKVATVSKNGKVTLKGVGIANITIRAASTKNYKATSVQVKVTVKPAKVALTSLKTMKGKKLSVKWEKAPNATGYEIQYSTDKKFKKGVKQKKISNNKTTSCTLTKLKDNKKYYVRVRAYKTVKVKGKKQTLKGAWGSVRGSQKIGTSGESSEILKSNQRNEIFQQIGI